MIDRRLRMAKNTVKMDVPVSDLWLSYFLDTAFDGNYGGCWHWCEPRQNGKDAPYEIYKDESPGGREYVKSVWIQEDNHPENSDFPGREFKVDMELVVRGLQVLFDGEGFKRLKEVARESIVTDEPNLDANDVDTIVQLGCFGEEVYT